ncbi:tryptophan synthase beta subunit-like PLP-dependent enzyme [Apodospora peruviana]|uniref:L-serine ammonia-lyase n=1 Tax=Apodospora peruviana TaxID=516989 RepID=A0AAE0IJ09_9PEZI|nr:tryptophan synthase beta subunit-like PLP-dependent enzyme [Apodospora peruviana]
MGSGTSGSDLPLPWIETPLIPSVPLSKEVGCNIFLKLENLQPSGSFKSRGVGNMMFRAAADCPPEESERIHFYCSSEGNAGLACATTAATLQCKATIVVPLSAPVIIEDKLKRLGAEVVRFGKNWSEADAHLRLELLANHDPTGRAVYVPPFDHPDIWTGAATMVDEVIAQMKGARIDGIVCSVGGGGLVNGVMEGLERNNLTDTQVLAVETIGADSLNASVKAGEHVTLPGITSIAASLGACRVSEKTYEWATRSDTKLISATVTDAQAAFACARFADDARFLVEVACGATFATAYNGNLRRYFGGASSVSDEEWKTRNVVLIVCGGNNTNLQTMDHYRSRYHLGVDRGEKKMARERG